MTEATETTVKPTLEKTKKGLDALRDRLSPEDRTVIDIFIAGRNSHDYRLLAVIGTIMFLLGMVAMQGLQNYMWLLSQL